MHKKVCKATPLAKPKGGVIYMYVKYGWFVCLWQRFERQRACNI